MNLQLTGFHHLTAVTANVRANYDFYTRTLGLRLVKKTVNQDDASAYHLFYGDGAASPGSDITFFDWPVQRERRGTSSIVRTGFRVDNTTTLEWWRARFDELGVVHDGVAERDNHAVLDFEDPEGQRLSLVVDDSTSIAHPWDKSSAPAEHQIRGLGWITLSVRELAHTARILTDVTNMQRVHEFTERVTTVHVFKMAGNGPAAELHVAVEPNIPRAFQGAGGVHHVAFRTPTFEEYDAWAKRLNELRIPNSGPVDRYYFRSLYFREPNGILFEIATDGPGFAADEPLDRLGERLALPPFLEPRRREIEAGLKSID
jgi:glyoxalase family protein